MMTKFVKHILIVLLVTSLFGSLGYSCASADCLMKSEHSVSKSCCHTDLPKCTCTSNSGPYHTTGNLKSCTCTAPIPQSDKTPADFLKFAPANDLILLSTSIVLPIHVSHQYRYDFLGISLNHSIIATLDSRGPPSLS